MKALLKQNFPNAATFLADRWRWHFRDRHDLGQEFRYRPLIGRAGLRPTDNVLEIGHCNYQTLEIARRVARVTVLNISGTNRSVATCGPRNITQIKGDACRHPFEEMSFDLCFMMAVLEHIRDDVAAVRNVRKALKPGGRFMVYVPDRNSHEGEWLNGDYPDHVRPGYNKEQLVHLLRSAGYEVRWCELVNGMYSAVSGELYYAVTNRLPSFRKSPHFVVLPFLRLASKDQKTPYPFRWGLYCEARRPEEPAT